MEMNAYQCEQLDALAMVRRHLGRLDSFAHGLLNNKIADYLAFRKQVAAFLEAHFAPACTAACYRSRRSACCSKDGIITFFGDVVVNVLVSTDDELDRLEAAIRAPENASKCIYLTSAGCLWAVKPVVCEMFLCGQAKQQVFDGNPEALKEWESLEQVKKGYTWPNQPVLFELLETEFLSAGLSSPLMYIHKSPGLSRIRKQRKS